MHSKEEHLLNALLHKILNVTHAITIKCGQNTPDFNKENIGKEMIVKLRPGYL